MGGVQSVLSTSNPVPFGTESQRDTVLAYFDNLTRINPLEFEDKWNALLQHDLTVKQSADILHRIARSLHRSKDIDLADKVKIRMLANWDAWQEPFLAAAIEEGLTGQNSKYFTKIMEAHRILQIKPTGYFMALWNRTINNMAEQFRPGEIIKIFSDAAHLGIQVPQQLRKRALCAVKRAGDDFQENMKINLIWASAVLDSIYGSEEYAQVATETKSKLTKKTTDTADAKKRYDSDLWFGWKISAENPKRQKTKKSGTEIHLQNFIQDKLKISTDGKIKPIKALPQAIDFMMYPTGANIAVEVDGGPNHCVSEADKGIDGLHSALNGTTLFRSAQMHKAVPDLAIVRIKNTTSALITGAGSAPQHPLEIRKKMAAAFVSHAKKAEPGIHQFSMEKTDQRYDIAMHPIIFPVRSVT